MSFGCLEIEDTRQRRSSRITLIQIFLFLPWAIVYGVTLNGFMIFDEIINVFFHGAGVSSVGIVSAHSKPDEVDGVGQEVILLP